MIQYCNTQYTCSANLPLSWLGSYSCVCNHVPIPIALYVCPAHELELTEGPRPFGFLFAADRPGSAVEPTSKAYLTLYVQL